MLLTQTSDIMIPVVKKSAADLASIRDGLSTIKKSLIWFVANPNISPATTPEKNLPAFIKKSAICDIDKWFNFQFPICWFGNINSNRDIILTLGINPSDKEFSNKTKFLSSSINQNDPKSLIDAYNSYFEKPYEWFKTQQSYLQKYGLNADYGDKLGEGKVYQLIHVDLFPFATNPVWGKLKPMLPEDFRQLLFSYGLPVLKRIIEVCKPKLILSFGEIDTKISVLRDDKSLNFNPSNPDKVPDKGNAKKLTNGTITYSGIQVPIILSSVVFSQPNSGIEEHMCKLMEEAQTYLR